jgi:hypothetical protein
MSLKFIAIQVLFPDSVIPLMESNAMVVDRSSSIYRPFEVFISLALIELKL